MEPPSAMSREMFVAMFGGIFEHSPQIADAAYQAGLSAADDTAEGVHAAMVRAMHALSQADKLALIRAHPDLAGKLAQAGQMTQDSLSEQGAARLDQLTVEEFARFTALNAAYRARFGFPFIMAVRGHGKEAILAAFETRLKNDAPAELAEALRQIERITLLRLRDRFAKA